MRSNIVFVFSALSLFACSAAPDASTDSSTGEEEALSVNSGFYLVSHIDMRKCASPMCGGYFVQSINANSTKCADGTKQKECYVSALDTSKLGFSSSDESSTVDAFAQRHAIVRATMGYKTVNGSRIGILRAKDAWQSAGGADPTGEFYRVFDNGIRCIKAPWPSTTKQ